MKFTTRIIVHLDNFISNIRMLRGYLRPGTKICLPVKANAYGHGIVEIAQVAEQEGVDSLLVADLQDCYKLKKAGVALPIVKLTPLIPQEIPGVVELGVEPVVTHEESIALLDEEGKRQNCVVPVHLKVDTGMGRNGCLPDEALALAKAIVSCSYLKLSGLCTHFAGTDLENTDYTNRQCSLFNGIVEQLSSSGIRPESIHASNSGGAIWYPEATYDMVRPGIILYGYYPSSTLPRPIKVKPVMTLESRIVNLKKVVRGTYISYGMRHRASCDTWIATFRIGYGDGYFRCLTNKGCVVVRGKRYPVVGRICMDHVMVDLGSSTNARLYDPGILFGDHPVAPDAEELALQANTIPYEVISAISPGIHREYTGEITPPSNGSTG